jgi:hypothetical protein
MRRLNHLQPVDGISANAADDLDEDDRARLHAALDASIAEADAGYMEDFGQFMAELRQRR